MFTKKVEKVSKANVIVVDNDEEGTSDIAGFFCLQCETMMVMEENDTMDDVLDLFLDQHAGHGDFLAMAEEKESGELVEITRCTRTH